MRSLAALDLETTGLDPERDAVIEIGVVRFRGHRVESEWSTLVNPGRPVPPPITQLTGIRDEMLAGAPRLGQVLGQLGDFVGELPILGHRVAFDLSFLQPRGLFAWNETLDTYDLASVILPAAGRYRLSALAMALGIPIPQSHRALEDAHTTRQVYLRLLDRLQELAPEVVEEIARTGADVDWGAGWVFDEALRAMSQDGRGPSGRRLEIAFPPPADLEPLQPAAQVAPLDPDEVAAVLEPQGPIARRFPNFEHRPEQVTMTRAVAQALSRGDHLLVEAGTGTGKSLAYLVPALHWAARNGRRVVVSTNTINLQDQLIEKDIPDLRSALEEDYRAAVLKGRANYLCPRRLAALRQVGTRSPDEMRTLAKILVWMSQGAAGDRSHISLTGPAEEQAWARLSAESEDCTPEVCLHQMDGVCPYYRARRAAQNAHIVIVNHALLMADVATGNRVIPEFGYLIVDEAHHLEAAATRALSFSVTEFELYRHLRELGGPSSGLIAQTIDLARAALGREPAEEVRRALESTEDQLQECIQAGERFFAALGRFLEIRRNEQPLAAYGQEERVVPATRALPEWTDVEIAWEALRDPLGSILKVLLEAAERLEGFGGGEGETSQGLAMTVRVAVRELGEIYTNLERMIFEPDPNLIYWVRAQGSQGRVSIHAAPLDVAPLLRRFLWNEKESVVLTSATLTAAGSFDHIRRRLDAEEASELALGSPFDYESSTLLYLVNDIPEPGDRLGYQRMVEQGLVALCRATRGRALVLFTSYDQLRRTSLAIGDRLGRHGIVVYEQGEGASRHALLETFRAADQAVLLGTRSFWEGVDVPGEALSVLVIVRLPFDVPTDPIFAARAETYESSFDEYSLPEAILRFRQGFGRLIRTRSDRGVVVSFDRRLLSKRYGRAFLDSLPRCTSRVGPLAELPRAAARWIGE